MAVCISVVFVPSVRRIHMDGPVPVEAVAEPIV
jgi:hypothetical protein